ncbi:hypothetical protein SDC9_205809 [bioreactor metagenome]|uniref:Uncharacterized protein n=1 Tax=bioreactor metagenome TaxID=1076179 RepID=A0A645J369_9ZZZZ
MIGRCANVLQGVGLPAGHAVNKGKPLPVEVDVKHAADVLAAVNPRRGMRFELIRVDRNRVVEYGGKALRLVLEVAA